MALAFLRLTNNGLSPRQWSIHRYERRESLLEGKCKNKIDYYKYDFLTSDDKYALQSCKLLCFYETHTHIHVHLYRMITYTYIDILSTCKHKHACAYRDTHHTQNMPSHTYHTYTSHIHITHTMHISYILYTSHTHIMHTHITHHIHTSYIIHITYTHHAHTSHTSHTNKHITQTHTCN